MRAARTCDIQIDWENHMTEICRVIVQIAPAKGNDPGQVTYGFYKVVDGALFMTDGDGAVVRHENGEVWKHTLQPDENPRQVAARLTKEIRRAALGEKIAGFNRRLTDEDYPKLGIV
jgi:hypothetical protein